MFESAAQAAEAFLARDYVMADALATSVFLAARLQRPLLLEGEPGVGKTELARTWAAAIGARLVRLQCYEGLDASTALYDWDFPRQMLELRRQEARGDASAVIGQDLYSERFLLERPLLAALRARPGEPVLLLIDELDRADEAFEAFLLELLADFQVSIPEYGTVRAAEPPCVVLTSNRSRELHDALRRRCLYHWIDFPAPETEAAILRLRVPGLEAALLDQLIDVLSRLRALPLAKKPAVAEAIDWAGALLALDVRALDPAALEATMGCLLKHQADVARVRDAGLESLLLRA